jgi:hypothetical protein
VPDAGIHQEPVHIQIETKVTAGVDVGQLKRHCESFNTNSQGNFLVLLTKHEVSEDSIISAKDEATSKGIIFCKITFEALCESLKSIARPHEFFLKNIVDDYLAYCAESGLLIDRRIWLSIVPCGSTFNMNNRWGIYYQPTDRGYLPQDYIGIYNQKAVRLLGKISAVYDCYQDENNDLAFNLVAGDDQNHFRSNIKGIIVDSSESLGWKIGPGYRFFCVENFIETKFKKTSPNGIMGGRYWNITDYEPTSKSLEELASILNENTWE